MIYTRVNSFCQWFAIEAPSQHIVDMCLPKNLPELLFIALFQNIRKWILAQRLSWLEVFPQFWILVILALLSSFLAHSCDSVSTISPWLFKYLMPISLRWHGSAPNDEVKLFGMMLLPLWFLCWWRLGYVSPMTTSGLVDTCILWSWRISWPLYWSLVVWVIEKNLITLVNVTCRDMTVFNHESTPYVLWRQCLPLKQLPTSNKYFQL